MPNALFLPPKLLLPISHQFPLFQWRSLHGLPFRLTKVSTEARQPKGNKVQKRIAARHETSPLPGLVDPREIHSELQEEDRRYATQNAWHSIKARVNPKIRSTQSLRATNQATIGETPTLSDKAVVHHKIVRVDHAFRTSHRGMSKNAASQPIKTKYLPLPVAAEDDAKNSRGEWRQELEGETGLERTTSDTTIDVGIDNPPTLREDDGPTFLKSYTNDRKRNLIRKTIQSTPYTSNQLGRSQSPPDLNVAGDSWAMPIEAPERHQALSLVNKLGDIDHQATTPVLSKEEPSLLEQLFPGEVRKHSQSTTYAKDVQKELPRLPPPEFDEEQIHPHNASSHGHVESRLKTRAATSTAVRQDQTTILVASRLSTSLCDADFRRIVPRGQHIEEWRGPGDILRVIPSRDSSSLSPAPYYFLVFSNPAYARSYQEQVLRLHRLAQTYTPTSLDFPIPPPPGMLDAKGEDVHALLQDFTISPPSVNFVLRILRHPYKANVQRILDNQGYTAISMGNNKTGRAVMFWVDGYAPSYISVKMMLSKDGQDRGLQWGPLRGEGEIKVLNASAEDAESEERESLQRAETDTELKNAARQPRRWIISFEDESEARRFVRVWHRRPYPFPLQGESSYLAVEEPSNLVHAEFLW